MYILYGRPGWGSALTETQLAWYGLPYRTEEVGDLFKEAGAGEAFRPVNPLMQLPTLILPDGQVMTESAAITLHLADITLSDDLVPPPPRPQFLRWLVFLVANVYPTFTYADDPARFVPGDAAQKAFETNVHEYAKRLWLMMESETRTPWFLGDRFSALDIFITVMTRWDPRRAWFEAQAPKLHAIAVTTQALPRLVDVCMRNFRPIPS